MAMSYGNINLHNADLNTTAGRPDQHLKHGKPQIAFSGRSNVGKSSLVNCLLGRKKLARVSGEPGKTITVNYYLVDQKIYLVDLPGYGFAKRSQADKKRWSEMTQTYFEDNEALKHVLQLVDVKVGFTDEDRLMLDYMNQYGIGYTVVATKCDKLNKTQLNDAATSLLAERLLKPGTGIVLFSSTKGQGKDELWKSILMALNTSQLSE
ncbi:MAG TPA: ribosome biogenesis GTP-binding protein YihA/YsxC [Bacillota bacterium]|nr:ribosome biogenesis GTP-binding protein YihA/YsxC [Bacillota bacterium]